MSNYSDLVSSYLPVAYYRLGEANTIINGFDPSALGSNLVLSNDNKTVTASSSAWSTTYSVDTISSGELKYFEFVIDTQGSDWIFGIASANTGTGSYIAAPVGAVGIHRSSNSTVNLRIGGSNYTINLNTSAVNDVIGIGFAYDTMTLTIYLNGVLKDTIDLIGTYSFTQFTNPAYFGASPYDINTDFTVRMIAEEFSYSIPIGYSEWGIELPNTVAVDEIGNFPGTYTGSPTFSQTGSIFDDVDNSIGLNGVNKMVATMTTGEVDTYIAGPMTLCINWKGTSTGAAQICGIGKGQTSGLSMGLAGNKLGVFWNDGGYIIWSNYPTEYGVDINDGEWHNLVVSIDGIETIRGYVDGIIVFEDDIPYVSGGQARCSNEIGLSASVGYHSNTSGDFDEFVFYDRELSLSEIQNLYLLSKDEPTNYFEYVRTLNVSHHYQFNEPSGTVAKDSIVSYNSSDGTYISSPTLGSAGLVPNEPTNNAISLSNASNDYVDISNHIILTDYTCSIMVKFDLIALGCIIVLNNTSGARLYAYNSKLQFYNGAWIDTGIPVIINQKYHITITSISNQLKVYVNGILEWTYNNTGLANLELSTVGSTSANIQSHDGIIDQLSVFDYILNDTQIFELYEFGEVGNILEPQLIDGSENPRDLVILADQTIYTKHTTSHLPTTSIIDIYDGYYNNTKLDGLTKVNGNGTQCKVYIFNKEMYMIDSFLSEPDGSFVTNNINLTEDYHIVVKSFTGECPEISGILQPTSD